MRQKIILPILVIHNKQMVLIEDHARITEGEERGTWISWHDGNNWLSNVTVLVGDEAYQYLEREN